MNPFQLYRQVLSDRKKTIRWCKDKGLIARKMMCPKCGSSMRFDENKGNLGVWTCFRRHTTGNKKTPKSKRQQKKNITIAASINSWFYNSKISAVKVIVLTYCWCKSMSYEDTIELCNSILDEELKCLSRETVSDWFSYCREVTVDALDKLYDKVGMIGGEGHIVEIDETKFGKRKYNRGRMVEGSWIFGMIDITSKDECAYRLEICEDNKRNESTLMSYIQKHVRPGTTIYSDCWKAYDNLEEYGYKHYTVNHSIEYVTSEGVHTNNIESSWRPLKMALYGTLKDNLGEHLCEFLWRRECRKNKMKPFEVFIENIKELYKE